MMSGSHSVFIQDYLKHNQTEEPAIRVCCYDGSTIVSPLVLALYLPLLDQLEEFWSPNFDPVVILPEEGLENFLFSIHNFLSPPSHTTDSSDQDSNSIHADECVEIQEEFGVITEVDLSAKHRFLGQEEKKLLGDVQPPLSFAAEDQENRVETAGRNSGPVVKNPGNTLVPEIREIQFTLQQQAQQKQQQQQQQEDGGCSWPVGDPPDGGVSNIIAKPSSPSSYPPAECGNLTGNYRDRLNRSGQDLVLESERRPALDEKAVTANTSNTAGRRCMLETGSTVGNITGSTVGNKTGSTVGNITNITSSGVQNGLEPCFKQKQSVKRTGSGSRGHATCPHCNCLISRQNLAKHVRTHTRPHSCSSCPGRRFATERERISHEINVHHVAPDNLKVEKQVSLYTCHLCGKVFQARAHLATHVRSHLGEKPFPCTQCRNSYSTKSNLLAHMKIHEGTHRNLKCPVPGCSRMFSHPTEVKQHQYSHSGVKIYSCKNCDKYFSRYSGLYSHLKKCPLRDPDIVLVKPMPQAVMVQDFKSIKIGKQNSDKG